MNQPASRRAFLQGRFSQMEGDAIRPPGAVPDGFEDVCTKCGDCLPSCPEAILTTDPLGFPILDPNISECTFCGACADVCPSGALTPALVLQWPWRALIADSTCLSMNGVSCRTCQDNCDHGAIRFRLQTGGQAVPLLDTDACTGCGACVARCPVQAVTLERQPPLTTETVQ